MGVSMLVLCALLAVTSAQVKLGDWVQQSKKGNVGAFVQSYAFDPAVNIQICQRRGIFLAAKPGVDFSGIFNKHLKALGKAGGGTLRLGPGYFHHSKQIHMPSNTCIRGAGIDSTVIKLVANAPKFPKAGNIRSFWTKHITITDLTIDGNRANQPPGKSRNYGKYGFFSELSNFVYLAKVRVRNNVFYGWDPHGSKKYWSYRLVMEGCKAENNGLDGFTIDQTIRATLVNCFSKGNDRHGFNIVTGTQLAAFTNCAAVDNGYKSGVGFGFVAQNNHFKGTGRLVIRRCTARNNFKGAVKLRDVHTVFVEDSLFTGRGKQICYELDGTKKVWLKRNACNGFSKSRKFKITPGAKSVEQGDRSKLRGSRAVPRSGPAGPAKPGRVVSAIGGADPTCKAGKRAANACCPRGCLKCGGMGCGAKRNFPGFLMAVTNCCVTPIRRAGLSCRKQGPPCLLL